jgi:hypothetical protein
MSYSVHPYAVDFQELARSRGAKDAQLTTRAVRAARRLYRSEPSVAEAVRDWIEGARSTRDASTQACALESLAAVLGERLPNEAWSSMRRAGFDQVDEVLKSTRSPSLSGFFFAGPPRVIRVPTADDFPVVGHMLPREVARTRSALTEALSMARASKGEAPRSIIEGSSSWHIFERPRSQAEGYMLLWDDRVVRVQSDTFLNMKKVHRSREAAYKDARTRIRKWLRAGYRWNNLALLNKKRYKQALLELESASPVPRGPAMSRQVAASIEQFVLWLETAAKRNRGLLFFYY